MDKGITVAEVTYCNSISVAEHIVMMILALVRNYIPSYGWVVRGGWNIADCVERSYDLEGMNVGTVAAGRIGLAALRRLKPFDVKLHYYDKHRLPEEVEKELGLTFHPNVESLVKVCDVVTINTPLHPETEHMFNDKLIGMMKRGSYIVNTARGKICDRDAIVRALESGQLAGYAGDVWFPQPAPKDHPWRTMPHHGMTPHISGSSLSAQTRYAAGTREILECYFAKKPIRTEYLVVDKGKLAGVGAHSYTAGDATKGSEEAAKFKKRPDARKLTRKRRRHHHAMRRRTWRGSSVLLLLAGGLLRGRLLVGGLLFAAGARLMRSVQLVGLGFGHLPGIDQSSHAGVRDLLDVARHAGAQRLGAESVLVAIGVVVPLAIALLAPGDGAGQSGKREESKHETRRAKGDTE